MKPRNRRRQKKGLNLLLGAILIIFVVVAAAVGIKYVTGSLGGSGKTKAEAEKEEKQEDKNAVKVTGIQIAAPRETIRAGEGTQLTVTVTPDNATDKTINWTVSGGGGTVSEDYVLTPDAAAGKSTVEITAEAADGSGTKASISLRILEAIDPHQPMVAITYDDGPSAETTPTVLDALEANYGVATFFMQGQYISGNEELLKRSYAMGNELANHSWDHPQLTTLSADGIKKQIDDTDALIKEVCPEENPILRPPYGAVNDTVKSVVGKPIIMWSLDTLDWKTRSTEKTIEACMTAKDGDIILMHDIHEPTVAAAEDVITGLQEKGFQLVTVSELYHYRNGDFENGSVHYSMSAEEMDQNTASATETSEDGTVVTTDEEDGADADSLEEEDGSDTENSDSLE
ncbi:MAG: polysaccharide deacetylase family protein [Lachnospiraceae bacterium]|nr:polysaccharide deacetylase family protein [Lachnospiraceae bacterium]